MLPKMRLRGRATDRQRLRIIRIGRRNMADRAFVVRFGGRCIAHPHTKPTRKDPKRDDNARDKPTRKSIAR